MRRFVAYIMIFSFVIAIFDVVDIYDLQHDDGSTIFSTQNPHADNSTPDSLDDQGIEYTTVHNLFLPTVLRVCIVHRTTIKVVLPIKLTYFYHHIPGLTQRPPRILA